VALWACLLAGGTSVKVVEEVLYKFDILIDWLVHFDTVGWHQEEHLTCKNTIRIFCYVVPMYSAVCAMGRCLHQIINAVLLPVTFHTKHNRFMALFPGLPWWASARRNLLLDFMVQVEISEADTPTIRLGATRSRLISTPPGRIQPNIRYIPSDICIGLPGAVEVLVWKSQ